MEYLAFVPSELLIEDTENQLDTRLDHALPFAPDREMPVGDDEELVDQDDDRHGYSYPSLFF